MDRQSHTCENTQNEKRNRPPKILKPIIRKKTWNYSICPEWTEPGLIEEEKTLEQ